MSTTIITNSAFFRQQPVAVFVASARKLTPAERRPYFEEIKSLELEQFGNVLLRAIALLKTIVLLKKRVAKYELD